MHHDPISDYATRIRNAIRAGHAYVEIPASRLKRSLTHLLVGLGCLSRYSFEKDNKQGILRLYLKKDALENLRRVSTPGQRIYLGRDEISRVRSGLGFAILSTSQGIMTGRQARRKGIGGEYLLEVW